MEFLAERLIQLPTVPPSFIELFDLSHDHIWRPPDIIAAASYIMTGQELVKRREDNGKFYNSSCPQWKVPNAWITISVGGSWQPCTVFLLTFYELINILQALSLLCRVERGMSLSHHTSSKHTVWTGCQFIAGLTPVNHIFLPQSI